MSNAFPLSGDTGATPSLPTGVFVDPFRQQDGIALEARQADTAYDFYNSWHHAIKSLWLQKPTTLAPASMASMLHHVPKEDIQANLAQLIDALQNLRYLIIEGDANFDMIRKLEDARVSNVTTLLITESKLTPPDSTGRFARLTFAPGDVVQWPELKHYAAISIIRELCIEDVTGDNMETAAELLTAIPTGQLKTLELAGVALGSGVPYKGAFTEAVERHQPTLEALKASAGVQMKVEFCWGKDENGGITCSRKLEDELHKFAIKESKFPYFSVVTGGYYGLEIV